MHKHLLVLTIAFASAAACTSKSDDRKTPPAADNTKQNARDRAVTPTADNAVTAPADRDITQKIRKAIVDDSTLSTNAHNVKVVVTDGAVTLVGPVASNDERTKVEQIAKTVSGRDVTNDLEVTN
jgi:osmotically-inducible protein OsmY